MSRTVRVACAIGPLVSLTAALYLFAGPVVAILVDMTDPALSGVGVPQRAWRLHRALSPRFGRWARARVQSKRPAEVTLHDISGTEWPVFGTVFYLMATEVLEAERERNPHASECAPREYAGGAIDAAAALLVDPHHATWVKQHWGGPSTTATEGGREGADAPAATRPTRQRPQMPPDPR